MSGRSLASRTDPLAKITFLLMVSIGGMVIWTPEQLALSDLLVLCAYATCGFAELRAAYTYRWTIVSIPVMLMFYHVLVLVAANGSQVTVRMLMDASTYSLRILGSVLALCYLLVSTDIRVLANRAMEVGVPRHAAFAVFLMLRFMDILRVDAAEIQDALLMRTGGCRRSREYLWLLSTRYVVTLVILGMLRSEQTALAMDLRGFDLAGPRTSLYQPAWAVACWFLPISYLGSLLACEWLL